MIRIISVWVLRIELFVTSYMEDSGHNLDKVFLNWRICLNTRLQTLIKPLKPDVSVQYNDSCFDTSFAL